MLIGTLTPTPYQTVFDANGNPVSGALINVYAAGTLNRIDTFTDVDLAVANTNPIVADSAGRYVAFLTPNISYKYIITDAAAVAIRTQDNILTVGNSNVDTPGIAGGAITVGDAVYMSDGTGGETAGRWYPTDADFTFRSTTPQLIGFSLGTLIAGATGTIRVAGRMPGLAGLVAGSTYYLSTAAGALTTVAPTNGRVVGMADSTTSLILAPSPSPRLNADMSLAQGRLTLTTAVPVTRTDVLAAVTVFWTPYKGRRVSLYTAAGGWIEYPFTELSIAVPAVANATYDVFIYDNAGVPTLELSAAWNTTNIIFAAGPYSILRPVQDGIFVKSTDGTAIDATRRYLGSFRTTAVAGQTEDSRARRLVYTYGLRVRRDLQLFYDTAYAYAVATYRQANALATNQVEVLQGAAEGMVDIAIVTSIFSLTVGNVGMVHVGEDSTTTPAAESYSGQAQILSNNQAEARTARLLKMPTIGWHRYVWLEFGAVGANWNAASGGGGTPHNGMFGSWEC